MSNSLAQVQDILTRLPELMGNSLNILTQLSKYLFLILIMLFALEDYTYFGKRTEEKKRKVIRKQISIIYLFTILAFILIFLNTGSIVSLGTMLGICVFYFVTLHGYRLLYGKASMLLVNDMLMLLAIGFVMISRLDPDEGMKQFVIASAAVVIAFIIPVIVRKLSILSKLTWLYAAVGIMALSVVLVLATVSGGAKLSITIGGISFQFSELVKITLVFFMASKLSHDTSFKSVVVTSVVAALHVMILVLSTDLGTALVFFVAYLVIVYVATRRPLYPLVGMLGGSGLFAIGAGGWFGTGLFHGRPETIPVASKDFIFAAICEEFGGVFAMCLILVCMSMFLLIVNISMELRKNTFYKLVAIGLGAEYAFQVFLTIGGVTKFIPMTGITLPLVSYGGSSVMSTIILIAIIQGLYILREDEGVEIEKKKIRR